jgi:hypothetical protein
VSDPYLAAIIESVENGGEPVAISVALNSGAIITGYVRAAGFFTKATRNETRRERQAAAAKTPRAAHIPHLTSQQDRMAAIYEGFHEPGGSEIAASRRPA